MGVIKLALGFSVVCIVICLLPFHEKKANTFPHFPLMKQMEMAVYAWDGTGGDKQCLRIYYQNDRNVHKM